MKRRKVILTEHKLPERPRSEGIAAILKNPVTLLVIVMLCGIGFRVYKMHSAGIVADEAWTYRDYCTDLNTAITNYSSTNNHLLNSVFIVLTRKILGGYDHFIRIPSMLFGILFCIAITAIVHKTIRSQILKIVLLMLVLMNWFLVDLTILARGYAIALGVTYAGIALLMRHLNDDTEHKKNWLIVIALIVMNFFAFGSMLSSIALILSINAVYFGITIIGSIRKGKKTLIHAISRMFAVAFGSFLSLYLLYHQVFATVIRRGKSFRLEPFSQYLSKVLWKPLIYYDFSTIKFNILIYKVSLTLLITCAVICLLAYLYRLKTKKLSITLNSPISLIFLLTASLLSVMFLQNNVFDVSLGLPRNGVFILPLVLISSGIIVDRAAIALSRIKLFSLPLSSACIISMAMLFYLNIPATKAINIRPYDWGKQSSIGPLIRMLRQIDPNKEWGIKLTSPQLAALHKPIVYYAKFGHKVKRLWRGHDVLMVPEHPLGVGYIYFMPDVFKDHHCAAVITAESFKENSIYYQMHYKPVK